MDHLDHMVPLILTHVHTSELGTRFESAAIVPQSGADQVDAGKHQ